MAPTSGGGGGVCHPLEYRAFLTAENPSCLVESFQFWFPSPRSYNPSQTTPLPPPLRKHPPSTGTETDFPTISNPPCPSLLCSAIGVANMWLTCVGVGYDREKATQEQQGAPSWCSRRDFVGGWRGGGDWSGSWSAPLPVVAKNGPHRDAPAEAEAQDDGGFQYAFALHILNGSPNVVSEYSSSSSMDVLCHPCLWYASYFCSIQFMNYIP